MPIVRIETNVDPARMSPTLVPDLIAALSRSKAMGKAGKRGKDFAASIAITPNMHLGGSAASCALADLTSIGGLGAQENEELSKVMAEVICPGLGVASDRLIICFHDVGPTEIGRDGHTIQNAVAK